MISKVKNIKLQKAVFFISFLIIAACSPENSNRISPKISSLEEGEGNFGSLDFDQTVSKVFILKNETSSTVSIVPEITGTNADSFRLVSARGCSSIAPNKNCQVKVQVSARGLLAGQHQATLSIAPLNALPLAVVINPTPAPVVEVQVDAVVSTSVDINVEGKNSVSKIVVLRNIGPVPAITSPVVKDLSALTIASNNCPQELLPSKLCYVRLVVKGQNQSEELQGSLGVGSVIVPVNISATAADVVERLDSSESSLNFGDFIADGQKTIQVLSFVNSGNVPSNLDLSSLPPGYRVVTSSCASVPPKSKCYVRLEFTSSTSPGLGAHSSSLSLGSSTVNVNYGIVSPTVLSNIRISGNDDVLTDSCEAYQVSLEDSVGNPHVQGTSRSLALSGVSVFSDDSCSSPLSSLVMDAYQSQKNIYVRSSSSGLATLQVEGSVSNSKNINFYNSLDITPKNMNITLSNTLTFQGVGGKPPYVYTRVSGVGTVNSSTGLFSSNQAGSSVISVEDSLGNTASTSVVINSNLILTAGNCDIETHYAGQTCQVSATGGVGSLTFYANEGTINSSSGQFTSSCVNGSQSNIEVEDSYGNTASIVLNYACVYKSCLDAKLKSGLNTERTTSSGRYFINPSGSSVFKSYCDQETDGGGWTLVGYAGNINTSKVATAGSANHYPLFNSFGAYDSNALVSKNSFSRVDLLKPLAHYNSRFLARRTSDYNKQISFRLANVDWWGANNVTPTNLSNLVDNTAAFLKATITGNVGWQQKDNSFYEKGGAGSHSYPGIRWNTPLYENCDEGTCTGTRSFTTALNRRSILYWESYDNETYKNQWFHASPLTLEISTGATNSARDIEFYFRENRHPITCDDAKQKGALNSNGNQGNGMYEIDADGYMYGVAPTMVYCDMESHASYGYHEVSTATLDTAKMLAGKQFVKVVSDLGVTGATINTRVIGLFRPSAPAVNMLQGKAALYTTNNYVTHSVPPVGYNYMGGHNWFANNGVDINSVPYPNVIVFASGIVGLSHASSNGSTSDSEHAYVYYRRYTFTLWERP